MAVGDGCTTPCRPLARRAVPELHPAHLNGKYCMFGSMGLHVQYRTIDVRVCPGMATPGLARGRGCPCIWTRNQSRVMAWHSQRGWAECTGWRGWRGALAPTHDMHQPNAQSPETSHVIVKSVAEPYLMQFVCAEGAFRAAGRMCGISLWVIGTCALHIDQMHAL